MPPPQKTELEGIVRLDRLYEFVRANAADAANAYPLKTAGGKQYSKVCKELTAIPDCQGVYVWGRYDGRRYWHNIYFGMAGFAEGKKSLRKRILQELKDERAFVWHHCLTRNEIQCIRQSVLQKRGYDGDPYHLGFKRALLKLGALDVIWMRVEDLADVRALEADMIEALNPSANIERPAPRNHVQRESGKLFERFRGMIHQGRPKHASELQHSMDQVVLGVSGEVSPSRRESMAKAFVQGLNSSVLRDS